MSKLFVKRHHIGLFTLLLLLLAGCEVRTRTPQVFETWGRATLQGYAERGGETGLAARSDGSLVMLTWFGKTNDDSAEAVQIHIYDHLSNEQIAVEVPLDGTRPDILTTSGNDEVVWVSWLIRQDDKRVMKTVAVDWDGNVVQEMQFDPVDEPRNDIRWHKTLAKSGEEALLGLLDKRDVFTLSTVDATGGRLERVSLQGVVNADFQIDNAGIVHLVWSQNDNGTQNFRYAQWDEGQDNIGEPQIGALMYAGPDADLPTTVNGPVIGLEDDTAYVSWNRRIQTPIGSFLRIFYSSFALVGSGEAIAATESQPVNVFGGYPPFRVPAESAVFDRTEISMMSPSALSAAFPNVGAIPLTGQREEAAFMTAVNLSTQNRSNVQPAIFYFKDGEPLGYQVLTWTNDNSGKPAFAADADNNLYVGWADSRSRAKNPMYMISTADDWRNATDNLTGSDFGVIAYDMINRMARGVALIFVVIPWIIAPFFWFLVVIYATSGEMYTERARKLFYYGIGIYMVAKYFTGMRGSARLMTAIPGGGFIDPMLYQALIWIIPLIILGIAVTLAHVFYVRRTKEVSYAMWFTIVIGIDYLVSLFFYSIGFFA